MPILRSMLILRCVTLWFVLGLPLGAENLVVSSANAPLLASCGDAGEVIAQLPQGIPVRLRFAVAGVANRCYSVSAEVDGRRVSGYVLKRDVAGLEEFDRKLRRASAGQAPRHFAAAIHVTPLPAPALKPAGRDAALLAAIRQALEATRLGRPQEALALLDEANAPAEDRDAAILRAQAYLRMTRPSDALAALAPAIRLSPQDADLLGLTGFAHFQRDRGKDAERYLKQSLAVRHNPSFEQLLARVRREGAGTASDGRAYGARFNLRFEGEALPGAKARALVREFEGELNRIQFHLGCPFTGRLPVIIRTAESYRQATGASEWSGGQYDGRIHIAVPPSGQIDAHVRETFSHELVHACLARKGSFPAWLHEGLAQRFSGRTLSPQGRAVLIQLNRAEKLPSLTRLTGGWARLGDREANIAYGLAALAADILYQDLHTDGVRSLLNNPGRVSREAKRLDKRLKETLR